MWGEGAGERKKKRKKKGTKIEEVVGYEMEKKRSKEKEAKGRISERPIVESKVTNECEEYRVQGGYV